MMTRLSHYLACGAGCGLFLWGAAGGAATTHAGSAPLLGRPGAHAVAPMRSTRTTRRGRLITASGCGSSNSVSFVGIANQNDYAGGNNSAVAGGYADEACDTDDAIAAGYLNVIGGSDNNSSELSFIGSGQSNAIVGAQSFIGAGTENGVSGAAAFIGAGGYGIASGDGSFVGAGSQDQATGLDSFVGAGISNHADGDYSTVGGGNDNGATGEIATVAGGNSNTANQPYAFVGGGGSNTAGGAYAAIVGGSSNSANGNSAVIGAGAYNIASGLSAGVVSGDSNAAKGDGSLIGAGGYLFTLACLNNHGCRGTPNTVSGTDSFLGAGDQNSIAANDAFVGGGEQNTIAAIAVFSTIGGGDHNAVSGQFATIPGGADNVAAGSYSFAAGYHADAAHNGSFVWSDYSAGSSLVHDAAANQFVVRASGGATVYSSETMTSGVSLHAGSGTWASLSDRDAKTDIAPLDDAAILAKVATLPVSAWRYKTESGVRHVGPMAQDFYAAFHVGQDDRHITAIDEDGVALAAIKALHTENVELRARLAALEAKVGAISSAGSTRSRSRESR
jgi:hypothetical protein